jgi:hypothetical protein
MAVLGMRQGFYRFHRISGLGPHSWVSSERNIEL